MAWTASNYVGLFGFIFALLSYLFTLWRTRIKGPKIMVSEIIPRELPAQAFVDGKIKVNFIYSNFGDMPTYYFYKANVVIIGEIQESEKDSPLRIDVGQIAQKHILFILPPKLRNWSEGFIQFHGEYINKKGKKVPFKSKKKFPIKRDQFVK